jgi:phosphoribosylamine---glycine ligase
MVLGSKDDSMKVLVIGGGGREHAIVWKIKQGASVEKVWCAPGNDGIAEDAECLPLDLNDVSAAATLAAQLGADLTIVGPELPLVLGISDLFMERGLPILGPTRAAARLEGSKVFAKQFLQRHGIPTAALCGVYDSAASAAGALERMDWPAVIKADGLCAGKGVLVTGSKSEAIQFINRVLTNQEFGSAGERLLFEKGLSGEELSYIVLTDGEDFIPLVPTRDHKRAYDHDEGPNTGGMGAYSTASLLPAELDKQIVDTIVRPTLEGLREEGLPYRGFLYFGLMLTQEGPKVLEYNCRLGDPETEALLLRADFDLAEAGLKAACGSLANFQPRWLPGSSACVVIASEGYPGHPMTGREILGLSRSSQQGSVVFHASTRREGDRYYTTGGRVLVVAAGGPHLEAALENVYERIATIRIEGSFYRSDIGARAEEKDRAAAQGCAGAQS